MILLPLLVSPSETLLSSTARSVDAAAPDAEGVTSADEDVATGMIQSKIFTYDAPIVIITVHHCSSIRSPSFDFKAIKRSLITSAVKPAEI
jgi:hypothetical protein